jgi:hypothetical protein
MAVPFAGELVSSMMDLKASGAPFIDSAVATMPNITVADTFCKKLAPLIYCRAFFLQSGTISV